MLHSRECYFLFSNYPIFLCKFIHQSYHMDLRGESRQFARYSNADSKSARNLHDATAHRLHDCQPSSL
jgi:hypothetical protein